MSKKAHSTKVRPLGVQTSDAYPSGTHSTEVQSLKTHSEELFLAKVRSSKVHSVEKYDFSEGRKKARKDGVGTA